MTNKFGDISSSLELQPGEIIRRKLDGTGFESYEIIEGYTDGEIDTLLTNKVDKVEGKALSTNDYTTTEKNKLAGIESNANNYILPSNVVQDATYTKTDNNFTDTLKTRLDGIASGAEVNVNADWNSVGGDSEILNKPTIPTETSDLVNNSLLSDMTAGTNITIDKTDPRNPVISSTGGGGTSTLDGLTDVTITTPSNGQALTYNTATSQWINSTPSGGGDMLKSVYDTNNDGIVNEADVITNQGDLATLDNVDEAQIVNKAVTNTKLADMNANTIKGRLSGNGTPQDVAMADFPISTATQTALDGKVTGNSAITGATKTKITYDSKGLVTAGADLIEADIPTLAQSKITNLVTDLGNKQPLATVLTNTTASYTTAIDTRLANTSGTNTGDQDLSTLAPKGSITTSGLTQSTNRLLGRSTASTGAIEEITLGTNLSFTGATLNATGGGITADETVTLTNKRITSRVTTITSSGTPTVNTDNCDAVTITAQAENITNMTTNLSGTPTNFQKLIYRIKDNGTARTIAWGTSFVAMGMPLPTTTVISKVLTVGFIYDTVNSKWGCVASAQE